MNEDIANDASSNAAPETDATVAAMPNVTLPVFSATNTAPWFRRVEAQFKIKKISANLKSEFIVGALPEDIFNLISSWLNTYGDDVIPYADLKAKIIRACQPSPEEKSQRILELLKLPLGDQRPSDAYFELKNLATVLAQDGTSSQIDLLKVLWMLRLPTDIRTQIHNFSKKSEEDLTELADSIRGSARFAYSSSSSTAAAATPTDASPPMEDEEDDDVIAAIPRKQRRPERRFQSRQQQPRHHNSSNHNSSDLSSKQLCWYHTEFGRKAYKCQPHCIHFNSKNM